MKNRKVILAIFIPFLILNCNEGDVNRVDPPSRAILVVKNSDSSAVERGIDAIYQETNPTRNAIFLEWHPNQENTLTGYEIYRSEFSDRNFAAVGKVSQSFDFIDTVFIDKTVSLNQRYYYFVRAFDEFDQYGEPSDTTYYTVVDNPVLSSPANNIGSNSSPVFIWDFNSSFVPHYFVFRLQRRIAGLFENYSTKLLDIGDDYNPHQEWPLLKLIGESNLPAGQYQWRIDVIGNEFDREGSESAWIIFTLN